MSRAKLVSLAVMAACAANLIISSCLAQAQVGSSSSSASPKPDRVSNTFNYSNSTGQGSSRGGAGSNEWRLSYSTNQPNNEMLFEENGKYRIETLEKPDEEAQKKNAAAWKKVQDSLSVLRSDSASEENTSSAKKNIAAYLSAQFDHDQKKRQEQLKKLEDQVAKLKGQLQKREQSKEQMIELRLTLMLNDANGLSFPNAWGSLGVVDFGQPNPAYGIQTTVGPDGTTTTRSVPFGTGGTFFGPPESGQRPNQSGNDPFR